MQAANKSSQNEQTASKVCHSLELCLLVCYPELVLPKRLVSNCPEISSANYSWGVVSRHHGLETHACFCAYCIHSPQSWAKCLTHRIVSKNVASSLGSVQRFLQREHCRELSAPYRTKWLQHYSKLGIGGQCFLSSSGKLEAIAAAPGDPLLPATTHQAAQMIVGQQWKPAFLPLSTGDDGRSDNACTVYASPQELRITNSVPKNTT